MTRRRGANWEGGVRNVTTRVTKLRRPMTYWTSDIARKGPLVTVLVFGVCVYLFYADRGLSYSYGTPFDRVYEAIVCVLSHASQMHLWSNMALLLILGSFFEYTEGHTRTAVTMWGGGLLGASFHVILRPSAAVRGLSGAVYAVMWAQLSLLALNWKEMPFRYLRFLACIVLGVFDLGMYLVDPQEGVSYASHGFGALGGICIALTFGKNVRFVESELALVWFGSIDYTIMCVFGWSCREYAILFPSLLVPPILLYSLRLTYRKMRPKPLRRGETGGRPGLSNIVGV